MHNIQKNMRSQAGFTLVELAIVMIIIGLLIAGVLKGQELIGNARVTATVAQIKSIDAAVSTFKDTYQNLPGDMVNPVQRLPSCLAAPCGFVGDGNGRLASTPGAVPGGEATAFFPQLAVANLITGLTPVAGGTGLEPELPRNQNRRQWFSGGFNSESRRRPDRRRWYDWHERGSVPRRVTDC